MIRWLPLILFATSFAAVFARADSWTDRETTLAFDAYPISVIDRWSLAPSEALTAETKKILTEAVEVIRLNPEAWLKAVLPGRKLTAAELERLLRGAPGIPIRICRDTCPPCDSRPACLGAKDVGLERGTLLLVRSCALESRGCPGEKFELRRFLEESLGLFAHFKTNGVMGREKATSLAKKGSAVIGSTAKAVNGILGRCPGPYSAEDLKYLSRSGNVSQPIPALRRCGEKYRAILALTQARCEKGSEVTKVYRCDESCQALLCMAPGKTPQVRTFGALRLLLLRPNSCDGGLPTDTEEFKRQVSKLGC